MVTLLIYFKYPMSLCVGWMDAMAGCNARSMGSCLHSNIAQVVPGLHQDPAQKRLFSLYVCCCTYMRDAPSGEQHHLSERK